MNQTNPGSYFILICTMRSGYRPFMTFETDTPIDPGDLSEDERSAMITNALLASGLDFTDLSPRAEMTLAGFSTEAGRAKALAQLQQEADGPAPRFRPRN
jgi:hypothetical protein